MSDDDTRPTGRKGRGRGQGLPNLNVPSLSALTEVFGAAIDGASRMTRDRARELAERLLGQAGLENVDLGEAASEAGSRINQLAEEIIAARKANRDLLQRTIATELEKSLDKSLNRLGLARADEVAALREEVASLRNDLTEIKINTTAAATRSAGTTTAAKKTAAKKATGKKAAAKKTTAKKTTAKTAATPTPQKSADAPVRKAPVKKASTAKKSPASKRTGA